MTDPYSVAGHWDGDFDERDLQRWVKSLRARLGGKRVALGVVFIGPRFFRRAREVLEIVRIYGEVPLLVGCSGRRLIANHEEWEENSGVALALHALPGAQVNAAWLSAQEVAMGRMPVRWTGGLAPDPESLGGWLGFFEPFETEIEPWLDAWRRRFGPQPVFGGLASGDLADVATQLYLNGDVRTSGGVVVSVGGGMRLDGIVAHGCTPVGQAWTITEAVENTIVSIGNRPAREVLLEAIESLRPEERRAGHRLLFVGLAMDEYRESLGRGDYLIRDIVDADPEAGTIVVGARPRVGQTIQFQKRDPDGAVAEMRRLLAQVRARLGDARIFGGVLCSCNGRGLDFAGMRFRDAALVEEALGPIGLSGFFCDGEIGPVGGSNFLHGYTASLALFVNKPMPLAGA